MTFFAYKNLQKANDYLSKNIKNEQSKPQFHVCSPVGWFNDPNGFSYYNGLYHLFYQYHPYGTHWGPMHWGHVTSKDLIHWNIEPIALAPDKTYDAQGCFSGTAISVNNEHILMYTGVEEKSKRLLGKRENRVFQTQCIAIGDGKTYTKIKENPIINTNLIPEGSDKQDFRDPKIWYEDGSYFALLGSKTDDLKPQLLLFKSTDLKNWEFLSVFAKGEQKYGKMWECPDFFELDNKNVLIVSPQFMESETLEFHNGNGSICFIGVYNKNEFKFTHESYNSLDYGLDFYAPQTLEAPDGRRILIGWLQSWDNFLYPDDFNWSGMMTFPRELKIVDGLLLQQPVKEIEKLYSDKIVLNSTFKDMISYSGVNGRSFDLTLEINQGYELFSIYIASNSMYRTEIKINSNNGVISFNRTYSKLERDVVCTRDFKYNSKKDVTKVRVIMDKYSIEIFVNDGEQVFSSLVFTPLECTGIEFVSNQLTSMCLEFYKLS